jgi:hypothetical protein
MILPMEAIGEWKNPGSSMPTILVEGNYVDS